MLSRWRSWNKTWLKSLYVQIFVSFLAVCVLFFLGLALFWNYYFTGLFYDGKLSMLEERSGFIRATLNNYQDGVLSSRELRFATRIVARSFNGEVLYVDSKGYILNGSSNGEGALIPHKLDTAFVAGLKGQTGSELMSKSAKKETILTYYSPYQLNGQTIVVLLQAPAEEISEAISAVRVNISLPLIFSLIAVGLILFIISRRLAGPVHSIKEAALQIADGNLSARVEVTSEDEVGELARSFNYMAEQMQGWEDARQEFLANVSHELRSPLTSLRGLIVAMNDKVIPEERYSHYLQICDGEVQRLQRLVNDLLDLARIQNGIDVFRMRPVLIRDKLLEVLELMRPRLEAKELTLRTLLPAVGEPQLVCSLDPDRFAQVLQNLLTNAIHFTPAGGAVTVQLKGTNEEVIVTVEDTGIGMTEDELLRIWDRFYKTDQSRSAQPDGTGLGLTIVKHLVNGMNGTVAVRSAPGQGSEFQVILPRSNDMPTSSGQREMEFLSGNSKTTPIRQS